MTFETFDMPERLGTARLNLVQWRDNHAEELAVLLTDASAMRYMGGACPPQKVWRWMAVMAGQWTLRGCGLYAVEHDGVLVGQAGLFHPLNWPELELAYAVLPAHQGRGYATEAAGAIRDAAAARGRRRLVSFIDPDNHPSLRVAEKLGATREGDFDLHGVPVIAHRHAMSIHH